jgi:hypothetical protein
MVLLITYDLKKPGQNYTALHEEIKKAGTWWHHLESTWLIETSQTPQQWFARLAPHIDQNDHILIIEVKKNYWGWLPPKAWEWLNGRSYG